jgi:hypothetical protein
MSAAVTKAASSAAVEEKPHHWEILRATSLTLGAMPLVPVPFRAAAMFPADPGAVAVPVAVGRPAELGRQVLVGLAEQGS